MGGCLWLYINPSLRPYLILCVLYLDIRLVNLHSRFYIYEGRVCFNFPRPWDCFQIALSLILARAVICTTNKSSAIHKTISRITGVYHHPIHSYFLSFSPSLPSPISFRFTINFSLLCLTGPPEGFKFFKGLSYLTKPGLS